MQYPYKEPVDRLLTVEQTKTYLTQHNPNYGTDFTESDWRATTERLCALARLLWRMSQRELQEEIRVKSGDVEAGNRDS